MDLRISSLLRKVALVSFALLPHVQAALKAIETTSQYILANDRLYAAVNKTTGSINQLLLDKQDLLGDIGYGGPYLDCYC